MESTLKYKGRFLSYEAIASNFSSMLIRKSNTPKVAFAMKIYEIKNYLKKECKRPFSLGANH